MTAITAQLNIEDGRDWDINKYLAMYVNGGAIAPSFTLDQHYSIIFNLFLFACD